MTWIKVVSPAEADPHLRACYEAVYRMHPPEYWVDVPAVQRPDGQADSIVAAHGLLPEVMRHAFSDSGPAAHELRRCSDASVSVVAPLPMKKSVQSPK